MASLSPQDKAEGARIARLCRDLAKSIEEGNDIREGPGILRRAARFVEYAVASNPPLKPCPDCDGAGCIFCKTKGFVAVENG